VLFAFGYCRKLGRTVAFLEAELKDENGKLLAAMSATCIPTPMPENTTLLARLKI
jgi:acyl-coenzyme A thioesterase PaaI-like protein